jgi:hypothetical protein
MAPIHVEEVEAGVLEIELGVLAFVAVAAGIVLLVAPWVTACWPYARGYGRLSERTPRGASSTIAEATDSELVDAEKARRDDLQRKAMAKSIAAEDTRAARAELEALFLSNKADSAEAAAAKARLAEAEAAEAEAEAKAAAAARKAAKLTALAYAQTRKEAGKRIREYKAAKEAREASKLTAPGVPNAGLHMAIKDAIPYYPRAAPSPHSSDRRVKVSPLPSPAVSARRSGDIAGESELQRYAPHHAPRCLLVVSSPCHSPP